MWCSNCLLFNKQNSLPLGSILKVRPLLKGKLNHFLRNEKCWIKSQLGHLQNKSKNLQKNEKGFFDNTMVLDCNSAALFLKQILERVTEEDLILFLSLQQWSQQMGTAGEQRMFQKSADSHQLDLSRTLYHR